MGRVKRTNGSVEMTFASDAFGSEPDIFSMRLVLELVCHEGLLLIIEHYPELATVSDVATYSRLPHAHLAI